MAVITQPVRATPGVVCLALAVLPALVPWAAPARPTKGFGGKAKPSSKSLWP